MVQLLQRVLDNALIECVRWERKGLDLTVAVNLNLRNLLDPGLVENTRLTLPCHGLPARPLEPELVSNIAQRLRGVLRSPTLSGTRPGY